MTTKTNKGNSRGGFSYVCKLVSAICIFAILNQSIAFAQVQAFSKPVMPRDISSTSYKTFVEGMNIPVKEYSISEKHKGTNDRNLIIIQDAHGLYSVQKNISAIINSYIEKNAVSGVLLEGASGLINTERYSSLNDGPIKKSIFDHYLRQGILSGAEYSAITNEKGKGVKFYGVEDLNLYKENLDAFENNFSLRKEAFAKFFEIEETTENFISSSLNNKQQEFLLKERTFFDLKISFTSYISFIYKTALLFNDIENSFPNEYEIIKSVNNVKEAESTISYDKLELEKERFIAKVLNRLTTSEKKEFVKASLAFKKGLLSGNAYFPQFFKYAESAAVDINAYPMLKTYIELVEEVALWNRDQIKEALDAVSKAVADRLFSTDTEKAVKDFYNFLHLYKKLISLTLTRDEYFSLYQRFGNFEAYTSHMSSVIAKDSFGEERLVNSFLSLRRIVGFSEKFYKKALLRDRIISQNIFKFMERDKGRDYIVVAGGFHKEAITSFCKYKDISFSVINPLVKKGESPKKYFSLLLGKVSEIDSLFANIGTRLSPPLVTAAGDFFSSTNRAKSFAGGLSFYGALYILLEKSNELLETKKSLIRSSLNASKYNDEYSLGNYKSALIDEITKATESFFADSLAAGDTVLPKVTGLSFIEEGDKLILKYSLSYHGYDFTINVGEAFDKESYAGSNVIVLGRSYANIVEVLKDGKIINEFNNITTQVKKKSLKSISTLETERTDFSPRCRFLEKVSKDATLLEGVSSPYVFESASLLISEAKSFFTIDNEKARFNLSRAEDSLKYAFSKELKVLKNTENIELFAGKEKFAEISNLIDHGDFESVLSELATLYRFIEKANVKKYETSEIKTEKNEKPKYHFAKKLIASLEALSLVALFASGVLPLALPVIITSVILLHTVLMAGVFLNETGHSLVARLVYGFKSAFSKENLRGNIKGQNALKLLIPIVGWLGVDEALHVNISELSDDNIKNKKSKSDVIRMGGYAAGTFLTIGFGLVVALLVSLAFPMLFSLSSVFPVIALGVSVAVLFASFSDFTKSAPLGTFFCGNVGILSGAGKKYKDVTKIFKKQLDITKVRGEQAGGFAFINPEFFKRSRIVNQKRADLTGNMLKHFNRSVGKRNFTESNVILSHLRFATSSASTVDGTHPHAFTPEQKTICYNVNADGSLLKAKKRLVNFVTHNGDFNGFDLSHEFKFAKELSALNLSEVNAWLKKILYPSTAPGDSVNIAGMMDLLHTKGMPKQSIRLAYYRLLAKDVDDVFNENILNKLTKSLIESIGEYTNVEKTPAMIKKFKEAIEADKDFINHIGRDNVEEFVKAVFDNFYNGDIASAVRTFSKGSVGSFGMAAASTVVPGKTVLYASGQPLATGISEDGELISWASEPAALKIKDKDGKDVFRYFVYLDDVKGDVLDLGLSREGKITMNAYSAGEEKNYKDMEALFASGKIVDAHDNKLINTLPVDEKDPIKKDKREIPEIMGRVTESMQTGLNAETGQDFSDLVLSRLKNKSSDDDTADIVFVGEETSAMHAQSASAMLGDAFKNLKTATVSGNDVISSSSIYNGKDKTLSVASSKGSPVKIGKDTIVLSISQSGQTFSTYQATNYLTRIAKNVFALTGETDTLMGRAVGQKYYRNAPFTKRIFTNLSGYRHAEASTVASVATGHLLTEIMLKLFKDARREYKDDTETFNLKDESIAFLEAEKERLSTQRVPKILDKKDPVNKNIAKKASKWAEDILESLTVLTISKAMVFGLVLFGVAPLVPLGAFVGLGSLVQLFKGNFGKSLKYLLLGGAIVGLSFITMPFVLQIAIAFGFTFFGEIVTTALRLVQGRNDKDRLYGARSIVISDTPYVQKMLESYATKLFGNSHGIASVVIKSGKTNNIPHYFAHQVVRGGKALFNIPGEMLFMRKQRNAVMMNVMQVLGIQNRNAGAEVATIGHNGEAKATDAHHHLTLNSKAPLLLLNVEKAADKIASDAKLNNEQKEKLKNILSTQMASLFDTYGSSYFIAEHIADMLSLDNGQKDALRESVESFLDEEMDLEKIYENRINAVERYVANIHFFDVLAEKTSKLPWYLFFLKPIVSFKRWTTHNRTRVATTASPQSSDDIAVKIKILGKPLWETKEVPATLPESALPFEYVAPSAKIDIPSFADIKTQKLASAVKDLAVEAVKNTEPGLDKAASLKNMVFGVWEEEPAYNQALKSCIADIPAFVKDIDKNYVRGLIPLEGSVASMEKYVDALFSHLTLKEKAKITEYLFLRKSIEDKNFLHSLKNTPYYKSTLAKVILIERTEDKLINAMLADSTDAAYIDAIVKNIINDEVLRSNFSEAYEKLADSDIFDRSAAKKLIAELVKGNQIPTGIIAVTLLKDFVTEDVSFTQTLQNNIDVSKALHTTSMLRMAA